MFTKSDKKFLKDNFATKDDLKNLAKQKDLLAVRKDLHTVRKDLQRVDVKVDEIKQDVHDLTGAVGAIFEWTDDIHRAIVGKPTKRVSGN